MTLTEKIRQDAEAKVRPVRRETEADHRSADVESISEIQNQMKDILSEFNANKGFTIDSTTDPLVEILMELYASKDVAVALTQLLSTVRYYINHKIKGKDIVVKVGYKKPPTQPMNFTIGGEVLEEVYPPGNDQVVIEIN